MAYRRRRPYIGRRNLKCSRIRSIWVASHPVSQMRVVWRKGPRHGSVGEVLKCGRKALPWGNQRSHSTILNAEYSGMLEYGLYDRHPSQGYSISISCISSLLPMDWYKPGRFAKDHVIINHLECSGGLHSTSTRKIDSSTRIAIESFLQESSH
jgi:hypothetical protein